MTPVDPRRTVRLNSTGLRPGPVVYWMSREQRVSDNWGLMHAQKLALERQQPLAVAFTLADTFLGAGVRQYGFMLRGLEQVAARLAELNIPFFLLRGDPPAEMCRFVRTHAAGTVITDFDPLRIKRQWREQAARDSGCTLIEVDGHNIVPCRFVSQKQEFGAYTLRPKLHRLLPEFLTGFPRLGASPYDFPAPATVFTADSLIDSLPLDRRAGEVPLPCGEAAAHERLHDFIAGGLQQYDTLRNDPNADGQSGLSPYLHFGQISPQRVALEVARAAGGTVSGDAFLEELIVRRELSDNFCWYNSGYDAVDGFPEWSRKTHAAHRHERRSHLYTAEEFDRAATHDQLWNAAQNEMVTTGRMHGYLRMYWAKKILEWSPAPEEAMAVAITLNDRWQLDGRDPNGYAGIAWSIGGVHDRAWGERPVYGKIRYMNDTGCKRKFNVEQYIRRFSAAAGTG